MAQLTDFRAKVFVCLLAVFLGAFPAERCSAAMYSDGWGWTFNENNSGVAGTVASYLSVDVVAGPTDGTVDFVFDNSSNEASAADAAVIGTPVITEIYFEDGDLLDVAAGVTIINDTGTSFLPAPPISPGNPPGFNRFWTTSQLSADSSSGGADNANGVGAGESVTLRYTLKDDLGLADVITALNLGFDATEYYEATPPAQIVQWGDTIRIGLHVRGVGEDNDFSEGYLLTPVPTSVLLGMLGLGAAGMKLRKYA